ncbi:MAG: nucleoside transporter C-terminal domain-containing protein [Myxococcota bacterium]|nr:nucleoside transporter C-terminal domain-containing protein [Myxococcota bacterium]
MERLLSFVGLGALVGIAWLMSVDRKAIQWRPVLWGIGLQLLIGLVILLPQAGQSLFQWIDVGVNTLLSFSEAGSDFLFQTIEPHNVEVIGPDGVAASQTFIGHISPPLKTVAFWVLPSVIFFSALMSVLYHYGIMQRLVVAVAWVMQRTMGTSGAESLSAAANIFVGQTEAPLMIRPFVKDMTQSELHAVMVGGFATVAGGVMAIYVGVLGGIPGIAGHLVIASIMSAPAALAISKLMVPETEASLTQGSIQVNMGGDDVNGLDALSRGTLEGLQLALNIAAMLVVFVAMIAMVNGFLSLVGGLVGLELTLEGILGWIFSPVAFLMGVPWQDCAVVGQLLGEKLVLTELIAFFHLSEIINGGGELTPRSQVIASYALCGFANFASIGIQIGGIGGIAPERRGDLARIGLRAMIGGTLAAMMTGTVAGIMYTG